ncbi:amidase [Limibacillus halophilus]|uniref:Asp-tRNA(Asn)/Glu-tRNA(Gln) amidotransferase A subunit family amidase n=1 Tax=Limibacillus halophilus TaxID=1579333 RepID=A0A839SWV3_9PROT|nr:amidase [Limibacillus halophilus]MBB3066982.1 Asp-tRNA(Asn)/Glu-tRNA(Gln) amidotransferase A subunit family amidase [Limibacillus halophilus]
MTDTISDESILDLSAVAAAEAVHKGRLTPYQIEEAQRRQIIVRDVEVQAWVRLAASRGSTVSSADGIWPLSGVSVGVKDIFDTVDMPTANGSSIFATRQPERDAWIVERLRRAGATILGKTHTTEFAYFHPAPTQNPLNPKLTPGGSSSGSAAAVADGMVPVALGSQTAGSTIRPAAFCGIFGFKPTHGLVSLDGTMCLAQSLDTLGLFARHPGDLALVMSALTDSPWDIRLSDVLPYRFAIFRGPHWDQASPEVVELFDRLAEELPRLTSCRFVNRISGFESLTAAQETVMARETFKNFQSVLQAHSEQISTAFRDLCRIGAAVSDLDYRKAQLCRSKCYCALRETLAPGELILTPAAPGTAPQRHTGTGDPIFNRLWTLLGVPCVSVPVHRSSRLPLAVQVIGGRGEDQAVLRAAEWLSQALPSVLIC